MRAQLHQIHQVRIRRHRQLEAVAQLEHISIQGLSELLQLDHIVTRAALTDLQSILVIPKGDDVIQMYHASLHDYLVDQDRCTKSLWIDPNIQHTILAKHCLWCMNSNLKQDMCKIGDPTMLNKDIVDLEARKKAEILEHKRREAARRADLEVSSLCMSHTFVSGDLPEACVHTCCQQLSEFDYSHHVYS